MDAGRRHEIPGSQTKKLSFTTQQVARSPAHKTPVSQAEGPRWVPGHEVDYIREGEHQAWGSWTVSKLMLCPRGRHYLNSQDCLLQEQL